jgi:hypothetical protein
MRLEILCLMMAAAVVFVAAPGHAADDVQADVVIRTTRAQPTHRLIETHRVEVPYGNAVGTIGFVPAGSERLALGPAAFDVDGQGAYVVADPVRRQLVRVVPQASGPVAVEIGQLPLPMSDLAVDADGFIYLSDLRSRTVTAIGPSTTTRTALPRSHDAALRFLRRGRTVVLNHGGMHGLLARGTLQAATSPARVEKCNAEAGLVTMGTHGRRIQVEIGAPLASIRLLGESASGDIFLVIEQFRERRRLAVDRQIVLLDASGALKARLPVIDQPAVHPTREFALAPDGSVHQMVPGLQGVTFVRWEVRR